MHVFCTEVVTRPHPFEELKNPLALGGEPLTTVVEVVAQVAGDSQESDLAVLNTTCYCEPPPDGRPAEPPPPPALQRGR